MLKPCRNIRCRNLTEETYCSSCKRDKKEDRPNSYQRGYNRKWQKARNVFLSQNALCKQCEKEGRITLATVVDHIVPHKGNQKLFWDVTNWQSLCETCHNRKTAKEDMGKWK